ncbi:putative cyclin-dependent kinase F-2 [Sorghum bicolor]|jgi:cell division cycle 2-like protein|nr:putative cyclin-dependent kinase F-2 [Sorghum bicolor]|eukprot:XP_021317706.1 putative cyclin-dependent kinase F-2 [Sorghum bicolor]
MAAVQIEEPPEQKNNASSESMAPVPWLPAVAERYERLEKLGQGMFGDVYKAWDRVLERFVAVKRLSGRTDDRFVRTPLPDFAREVMSLAACRGHPSVVELLATYADCGRADGDCFVVTEYAGPMNLREYAGVRRRNNEPFDEDEVRDVMAQLLAGARHAHRAGVLHRDIVPENVIVDMVGGGRMVYKICGFGMSKPAAQADRDDSGLLASSSPYRAPELFLGSKDYDGRVDTWSLGCIMAELVIGDGVPFFGGALDKEVFNEMLHVVGTKGIVTWKGLERVAPRDKAALLRKTGRGERGYLKETKLPPEVLSPAGFKVLKSLLHSNPDRRLSAADALRKPWFRRRRSFCYFMPRCGP